ncbi:MAG: glycosyltransferase family 2 protein [Burkholderiales bacterium]|nr:glycosyltransferase family 2 protein [Burkholderiales bacterium]
MDAKVRNLGNLAGLQAQYAPRKVAILLCTYQGESYLAEQLESIQAQTHSDWIVWASDDASTDMTRPILEQYAGKWGSDRLHMCDGPRNGFASNFLSLVCNPEVQADCYAYSDQDDIWKEDKLEKAVDWLNTIPAGVPALYCSRTELVDETGRHLGYSPLFGKSPGFANALVQNLGGGNTMVFNHAARVLLQQASKDKPVLIHDWWTYMVISGAGGKVYYDAHPSLRYRQHGGNLVGSNAGWLDRILRLRWLLHGRFKNWNDQNIHCLRQIRSLLTPDNQRILDEFSAARQRWLLPRIVGIMRSGIYRQTLLGNLGLIAATLLKKI